MPSIAHLACCKVNTSRALFIVFQNIFSRKCSCLETGKQLWNESPRQTVTNWFLYSHVCLTGSVEFLHQHKCNYTHIVLLIITQVSLVVSRLIIQKQCEHIGKYMRHNMKKEEYQNSQYLHSTLQYCGQVVWVKTTYMYVEQWLILESTRTRWHGITFH